MNKIENDDIKTLMLKKEDAVCCVKDNLKRYAEIKLYPQTVADRVSGYSTSLLIVNSQQSNKEESRLSRALINDEEDALFINKYDNLISSLCEESSEYIIRLYLYRENIQVMKDEKRNLYYFLKDVYEILACLDDQIDFAVEDYVTIKNYEHQKNNEDPWKIKPLALNYLKDFRNGPLKDEIEKALHLIPNKERNALEAFIQDDSTDYTSYEYRMISRAITAFAYFFKEIDYSYEDAEAALRRTGSGWKKFLYSLRAG